MKPARGAMRRYLPGTGKLYITGLRRGLWSRWSLGSRDDRNSPLREGKCALQEALNPCIPKRRCKCSRALRSPDKQLIT